MANKAFDALTQEEQAWVLNQMTVETYQQQRTLIVTSQKLWMEEAETLAPAPASAAIFTALEQKRTAIAVEAIQGKTAKKGLVATVFNHRIATWQAVAASLLLFLLAQVGQSSSSLEGKEGLVQQPVDTVYRYITQVKEVLQPADTIFKIVYKEVLAPAPEIKESPTLLADASDSLDLEATTVVKASQFDDILQYCSMSNGQPASQDTFFQLLGRELQL